MFPFRKSVFLMLIGVMIVFILVACSQVKGSSSLPDPDSVVTPADTSVPEPTIELADEQEEETSFDPVVLFAVADEDLSKDVREIPGYQSGDIHFATDEDIQSMAEGHSPWRSVPDIVAESYTRNLIPNGISSDMVEYNVISNSNDVTLVDMEVPELGKFSITLQYGYQSDISFISEIVWHPGTSTALRKLKDNMTDPLVIYNLMEEAHYNKDIKEFPIYHNGTIVFRTIDDIHSVINDPSNETSETNEELSSRLSDPESAAEIYTRNLIPDNIPADTVEYRTTGADGKLTQVAIVVPEFGTYEVTLIEKVFQVMTKITFQPESFG